MHIPRVERIRSRNIRDHIGKRCRGIHRAREFLFIDYTEHGLKFQRVQILIDLLEIGAVICSEIGKPEPHLNLFMLRHNRRVVKIQRTIEIIDGQLLRDAGYLLRERAGFDDIVVIADRSENQSQTAHSGTFKRSIATNLTVSPLHLVLPNRCHASSSFTSVM